jgi:hypothetical protein
MGAVAKDDRSNGWVIGIGSIPADWQMPCHSEGN